MIGEKLKKQVEEMAQLWQLYQDPGGATLEAGSRWWFKLDGSEWGVDFGTMGVWTPYKDPETGKPSDTEDRWRETARAREAVLSCQRAHVAV